MFCWDGLRYFLALYRHRKLVIAGKALKVRHSTVARRIKELETGLSTTLFKKIAGFMSSQNRVKVFCLFLNPWKERCWS